MQRLSGKCARDDVRCPALHVKKRINSDISEQWIVLLVCMTSEMAIRFWYFICVQNLKTGHNFIKLYEIKVKWEIRYYFKNSIITCVFVYLLVKLKPIQSWSLWILTPRHVVKHCAWTWTLDNIKLRKIATPSPSIKFKHSFDLSYIYI